MKIFYSILFALFVLVSCGKYEKPFISFRSPEKRLMNKEWNCVNAINQNGIEFKVIDKIKFEISGEDSIFTRMTNYQPLNVLNYSGEIDTVIGTWTWLHALDGKLDKQRIRLIYPGANRVIKINILTNKAFEYIDESFTNSTYSYERN
jgi:hypothetical protein